LFLNSVRKATQTQLRNPFEMWQILNITDNTTDENLIHYGNRILNSENVCYCVVDNCLHLLTKAIKITNYNAIRLSARL